MMDVSILMVLFAVTLIAAIFHGISGFAFGIVVLMVFPHFFGYTEAVALASFMVVFVMLYNAFLYRKYIVWKQIPLPVVVFVSVDFLAVQLLKYVGNDPIWYKLLGGLFILMAAYLLWGQSKIKVRPTTANAVLFNAAGGLINGLFGAGGPVAAVYFLAVSETKEHYLGTTQMLFLINITIDFALRAANGMVTTTLVLYGVSCLWCIVVGLLIGKKLFEHISALTLRRIICAALLLDGIYMLMR